MPTFAPPNSRSHAPTFRGKSIFEWPTRRAGIAYSTFLDQYLAAHWWGYTVGEWDDLTQDEQEIGIAVYRCQNQIDALLSEPRYAPKPSGKSGKG